MRRGRGVERQLGGCGFWLAFCFVNVWWCVGCGFGWFEIVRDFWGTGREVMWLVVFEVTTGV